MLPPRLWAFGAEHRSPIVHADRAALLVQVRSEHRADDARGALWAQRQRAPTAIREREHLLLHDVGLRAHAAREELGRLEDGGLDGPVAERLGDAVMSLDQPSPRRRLRGQDVVRAARGSNLRHERRSLRVCWSGAAQPCAASRKHASPARARPCARHARPRDAREAGSAASGSGSRRWSRSRQYGRRRPARRRH